MRKWNCVSCPSCYWVLTRQLVRHLLEQFGPWSHIHESIFIFLIQERFGVMRRNDAGYRLMSFAEVWQHGLLQGQRSSFELTGHLMEEFVLPHRSSRSADTTTKRDSCWLSLFLIAVVGSSRGFT